MTNERGATRLARGSEVGEPSYDQVRIEVVTHPDDPNKAKGDLLENLGRELIATMQFDVTKSVRVTASEIDLHCQHRRSPRRVLVECKAQQSSLSADVLHKLSGKVDFHDADEGWLFSTGPLGRDAEGYRIEWENKPKEKSAKLTIYTPSRLIDALVRAGLAVEPPQALALMDFTDRHSLGEWTLLLTPFGRFWCIQVLASGLPSFAALIDARTARPIRDSRLIERVAALETSFRKHEIEFVVWPTEETKPNPPASPSIVHVQQGESWRDYRPSRPQDFVGRADESNQLLDLLKAVREGSTKTRLFAITGNSGMGKSSLIASLRSRSENVRHRNWLHFVAVDVRAARGPAYMMGALQKALTGAADAAGLEHSELRIQSASNPIDGPVLGLLQTLQDRQCVVCLVFDQFEEIYTRPDLFSLFESLHSLCLSTAASQTSLVLGFAWKSDATVHQEHPAYYLWQQIADHRMEIHLRRLGSAACSLAVTRMEKELGRKVSRRLRRHAIQQSDRLPWWLRKLLVHVFDQLRQGSTEETLLSESLAVESLFEQDMAPLSTSARSCLKAIAASSPAGWQNVLDDYGKEVVADLLNRRLVIRSGEHLNVYWDIFREYLNTGLVPTIELTYLPGAPSLSALQSVVANLDYGKLTTIDELAVAVGLAPKTVGNAVRDLVMLGGAVRNDYKVRALPALNSRTPDGFLQWLRGVMSKHRLYRRMMENGGDLVDKGWVVDVLKEISPAPHRQQTWEGYADRLLAWLSACGLIAQRAGGWLLETQDEVIVGQVQRRRGTKLFLGDAPPERTVEALSWMMSVRSASFEQIVEEGHRNAIYVLTALGMVRKDGTYTLSADIPNDVELSESILRRASRDDEVVQATLTLLDEQPSLAGRELGAALASRYHKDWKPASQQRYGFALRRWALWTQLDDPVPTRPNQKPLKDAAPLDAESTQLGLFASQAEE